MKYRALSLVLCCFTLSCTPSAPAPEKKPAVAAPAPDLAPPVPLRPPQPLRFTAEWKEIEELIKDGKPREAREKARALQQKAQAEGAVDDVRSALVKIAHLSMSIGEFEGALAEFKSRPHPRDDLSVFVFALLEAHILDTYFAVYSWEIAQRERTVTPNPESLTTWTRSQIIAAASAAYQQAWQQRQRLGDMPLSWAEEFLSANNYPRGVRDTLRDALSHKLAAQLAFTERWSAAEEAGAHSLDLKQILSGDLRSIRIEDESVHPLVRMAAVLDDLERWHTSRGRPESALAARLARAHNLALTRHDDAEVRATVVADLAERLKPLSALPLWAAGQDKLASLYERGDEHDSLLRAHEAAEAGYRKHPDSHGGKLCLARMRKLEEPSLELSAMQQDGVGKRSVEIRHKNLSQLHLRLYRLNLLQHVSALEEGGPELSTDQLRPLLAKQKPLKEWTLELPKVTDFREHRTFITPPATEAGFYVLAASTVKSFAPDEQSRGRVQVVQFLLSDLALVSNEDGRGGVQLQALSAETGKPLSGVQLELYKTIWRDGGTVARRAGGGISNAEGRTSFAQQRQDYSVDRYFALGRRGADAAMVDLSFDREYAEPAATSVLFYTDRSVYRPKQTIQWKIVVYRGREQDAKYKTQPGATATVQLRDANYQEVAKLKVKTNRFGTASGQFTIPDGRLLGSWRLTSSLGGQAGVRVEEYKRPTFEAKILDQEAPLRLGQPAVVTGEARYYFGLPVTGGKVKWRITRTPVYPEWWSSGFARYYHTAERDSTTPPEQGTAELGPDGKFQVRFTPKADKKVSGEAARSIRYTYLLAADVTDEGGETRSATRTLYVGATSVKAQLSADAGFFRSGAPAQLKVRRTDLAGTPRAGKGSYRVSALLPPAQVLMPAERSLPPPPAGAQHTPGDLLPPRSDVQDDPRFAMRAWKDGAEKQKGELVHGADGEAAVSIAGLAPGVYRLRYTTQDDFGSEYEEQHEFVVAGEEGVPGLALPLLLLAEQDSVERGGTARFLCASGYPDQVMFLSIFRDSKLVASRRLDRSTLVELPVRDAERGGFSVRLSMLRDHQFLSQDEGIDVPWSDRQLELSVSTFRDQLRPGGRETFRVAVKGPGLLPQTAELLAYMYDRSLDLFQGHSPPDVLSLYPSREGTAGISVSLQNAGGELLAVSQPPVETPAPFIEDTLRVAHEIGMGTLGTIGRGSGIPGGPMFGVAARSSRMFKEKAKADKSEELDRVAADPTDDAERKRAPGEPVTSSGPNKALAFQPPGGGPGQPGAPGGDVPLRENFAETAFFYPHLLLDANGEAAIEFAVPDSVTAWNFWAHALTPDLRGGSLKRETRTVKELIVRPYLPRFLREGDRAELKIVVSNTGKQELKGTVRLDIVDPETEQSVVAQFGLQRPQALPFTAAAGASTHLTVALTTPRRVGLVAFRVSAQASTQSGDLSDGELRPIPLLPGRVHLTQSRFITLKDRDQKSIVFSDMASGADPTLEHDALVVTVDGQLLYSVLSALPYLVQYPHECTEQTLNRFLSTGIVSSLYKRYPVIGKMAKGLSARTTELERFDEPDANRKAQLEEAPWLSLSRGGATKKEVQEGGGELLNVLNPDVAAEQRRRAIARLEKMQLSSGAFPWFPGGPADDYMTIYLLQGLARAAEFGVPIAPNMVLRASAYLSNRFRTVWRKQLLEKDVGWETLTFLNYVVSSFPKPSVAAALNPADQKEILDFSFKHWKEHSGYLKGMLALTLHRAGRTEDARKVLDSVLDAAKTTDEQGTFFQPEERAWLWYEDRIETHAFVLRALLEIAPADPRQDGLVKWLLLNKKLNQWKSTRATAEVLYSLIRYLAQHEALATREAVSVGVGPRKAEYEFLPDTYSGKKNQIVVPGPEVDPKSMASIRFAKQTPGLLFASATWTFSTEKMPVQEFGDFFAVQRRYFKRTGSGKERVLIPLKEGERLVPGDEVEVQLSLRSKHAAEYVHLRDPRAAGLEPQSQASGYRWDLGLGYYEEVRDSGQNFFFDRLPAGEYTFKYRLRASMAGTFRAGPATVQSMYAPEFNAYSTGAVIEIKPSTP